MASEIRNPTQTCMSNYEARLKSFNGTWPWDATQKPQPEELADAGLYYVGDEMQRDRTKCFCCNGVLFMWEAGDNAIREHILYFPKCEFIARQIEWAKKYVKEAAMSNLLEIYGTIVNKCGNDSEFTRYEQVLRAAKRLTDDPREAAASAVEAWIITKPSRETAPIGTYEWLSVLDRYKEKFTFVPVNFYLPWLLTRQILTPVEHEFICGSGGEIQQAYNVLRLMRTKPACHIKAFLNYMKKYRLFTNDAMYDMLIAHAEDKCRGMTLPTDYCVSSGAYLE